MVLGHNIVYNPQNHHLHGCKKPFQKYIIGEYLKSKMPSRLKWNTSVGV
jgi:hypothetical protein